MARKLATNEFELNGFTVKKTTDLDNIDVNSITLADSEDVASIDLRIEAQEDARSEDVDSLDTRVGAQEDARSEAVDSIDTRLDLEESATKISIDIPVSGDASHITIDYTSMGYNSGDTMVVHGSMRDAEDSASNPIIATQISGTASHTGVTFIFSDNVPENTSSNIHNEDSDYVMDIIVQKKMND